MKIFSAKLEDSAIAPVLDNVRSANINDPHLSTLQVKQLCVSALPEDQLTAAAEHTAVCQSCNQQLIEEFKRHRAFAPFDFTLEPEFWFRNDHLDSDDLVALADNTFDEETQEVIDIHLSTCETCREDIHSFRAFRNATAGELNVSYGPTYYEPHNEIPRGSWWQPLQTRPIYAVAVIVLASIAVLIGVIALSTRSVPLEANKHDQKSPGIEQGSSTSPSPAPNVVSSPVTMDDSAKVAVLKDAGGEVTIAKNGQVTGLDHVSENSRRYVARAVLSEQLPLSQVLRRLSGEQSALRGNENGQQEFRLLFPTRRVVIDDRPVFRWESLPDVSSYRVYVLDGDGNQVSRSEELHSSQTQWKAPVRFRRGQIFSWVVTAVVDGKKVVSPSVSAPEMKFAVLPTADFEELSSLKRSNSHLALGVFYATSGLLDEAERELQRLVELNPQSELPRKLLQEVRRMKESK